MPEASLKSRWMVSKKDKRILIDDDIYWILTNPDPKSIPHQVVLGQVEFCDEWKKWVFVPFDERQFSAQCLSDLVCFLEELNREKK